MFKEPNVEMPKKKKKKTENKDDVWTSVPHGLRSNDGSMGDQHHSPSQRLRPLPHPHPTPP